MTLESDELDSMLGKTIIVSMTDGARFRGTLDKVGDKVIVMTNIVEMADHGKWVKPVVSTATFADVVCAEESTLSIDDRAYLTKVVLYKKHILRIWPWEPQKMDDKEMVTNY
jgi:small nuclear ribonucleoprotein (snRNP)-like protein